VCSLACAAGFGDCDLGAANGCEVPLVSDPRNCGGCDTRCTAGANATPTCVASACSIACDAGYADCDGDGRSCEAFLALDESSCGACGTACTMSGDVCVRAACRPDPFPSDGSDGPFAPTASMSLAPGVYHFTTITIPLGVTIVTGAGDGVLELRAQGDVLIDGTIDASGSAGGNGSGGPTLNCGTVRTGAGGGATGRPDAPGANDSAGTMCRLGGDGGSGGAGTAAIKLTGGFGTCGLAGVYGGGGGGTCTNGGGGGGGYAGGGGGGFSATRLGGGGGFTAITAGGMGGDATLPGRGGEPGYGAYSGGDGSRSRAAGGGSIGRDAIADLAVASTFRPGSGGGGGTGAASASDNSGGAGGGGGGGAIRISTPGTLRIGMAGAVRADGGRGGLGSAGGSYGSGGGGSGGVVYLASPRLEVEGDVTARAGAGGVAGTMVGGSGGLGRIRISMLPELCDVALGTFDPPLASACSATFPAVPERTYVDIYPF
jgi:hypothetical protein